MIKMCSKSNISIFIIFLCLYKVDLQKPSRYATIFRNFSATSDTGVVDTLSVNIFPQNKEQRLAYTIRINKDVLVQKAQVILHRCPLNKSTGICEKFATLHMPANLNRVINMRNVMWSPLFTTMTPRPSFPLLKKNVYTTTNATLDADRILSLYRSALKYYFKASVETLDNKNMRPVVLNYEVSFIDTSIRM